MSSDPHNHDPNTVGLPAPTAWPIVAAFGLALLFFGLVSNLLISAVGFLTGLIGAIGLCLDVFPHPKHEFVPLRSEDLHPKPVRTAGRVVQMLDAGKVPNRAHIPVEVHPYTAGIFGGLVGAAVMALLACLWGVFKYGSIWYPINLLAAAGVPELAEAPVEVLKHFSLAGLIVGSIAHLTISCLVGLLYVVLVPMLPRRFEWLFGGVIPPIIWTGLIFASLRLVNPVLASHIDWFMFWICQMFFGLVCGWIVFKSTKAETMENWTIAQKLGVEAQHNTEDEK
jgi:hypothetical protein